MPRLTNAEVLRRAASIMKERGHAKHTLEDSTGRVCLYGAISAAVCGDPHRCPDRADRLLGRVGEYLTRKLKRPINDFAAVGWNNERDRTAEEVIAALRGTAKDAARRSAA